MKLELFFGSVIFFVAGITLADNSSEVMGQSEGGLKKYENPKHGLSFLYPSELKGPTETECEWCGHRTHN